MMIQLISKMRRGECSVAETEILIYLVGNNEDATATALLLSLPTDDDASSYDVWLRWLLVLFHRRDEIELAIASLKRHELDPLCMALLGTLYNLTGKRDLAVICWQRSADAGCCEGIYQLGRSYYNHPDGDEEHGFKLLCAAAEMCHLTALYQVGECYLNGFRGVQQDVKKGLRYYAQAINHGSISAINSLAHAYHRGWGVEKDQRRAASLFRQTLRGGDLYAQHNLIRVKYADPLAVIPYGEWCPDEFMHQFVPDHMHLQMRAVLLMHARKGSVFSMLPRVLLPHICLWICTE